MAKNGARTTGAPAPRWSFAPGEPLHRALAWLGAFVHELSVSRTTGMAAELAFWLFLSLVPLSVVAGLVVAKIAVSSSELLLLSSSLPPATRELVEKQVRDVATWNGGSVGGPAAAVFLWLASGGVHAVFDLLEVKAGAARPWWRRRLVALATCVGLSIGVAALAVLAAGLERIEALLRGALPHAELAPDAGALHAALRVATGFGTALGLVAGLFFIGVPKPARRGVPVWPGAALTVFLQALLGYGYVFYLSEVGVGSAYQAGLSIIGVSLMALYLFALALLVGAELNHVIAISRGTARDQLSSRIPPNAR